MNTMRAVRAHARGGTEKLVVEDAPVPRLRSGDALVRVYAAGITPTELLWDASWGNRDGSSRVPSIPSHELCGVVMELGPEASGVSVGDEVYGLIDFFRDGAAAEYVAVAASELVPRPVSVDPAAAAALPLSALTAWQALHDHAAIEPGKHVLVLGGAGGVGSYGVQLAAAAGARVSATCAGRDRDFVRQLGATTVLDYASEPVEQHLSDVDIVLDTVGPKAAAGPMAALRLGGVFVSVATTPPDREAARSDVRLEWFIVTPDREDLAQIAELVDSGSVRPVVSRIFPLDEARAAYEQGLRGGNRGKIVLSVGNR